MKEETEQLFKEEYKAAGVYGKIVTVPELAQLISSEGDKNPIVRKLVEHSMSKMSESIFSARIFGCNRIVLGYVHSHDWTVECSDGKKRKYVFCNIKWISIILKEISEVEVLGVDDKNPDKCYSAEHYLSQENLEYLLLTDEERATVKAVRLALAKEKILSLFKKGLKSINLEIIRKSTGLDSERYILALDGLVNVDKKLRLEGEAYVLREKMKR